MDLAGFARWAIRTGPFDGCDLDGGDVQDKAVECGLLVSVPYDPEKHGELEFDAEPGESIYEFSPELKAALRVDQAADKRSGQ